MSTKPNGGSAFPIEIDLASRDVTGGLAITTRPVTTGGMTLRDYFAGQALEAMGRWHSPHPGSYEDIARDAYALADAMLVERDADES